MSTAIKQHSTCTCCGKPLSDPISMEVGMGPVCRIAQKAGQLSERTGNLFANRACYDYHIDGRVLSITDLGGLKSVTNDIDNILNDIAADITIAKMSTLRIMYKDSMGIWDGIRFGTQSNYIGRVDFFSLNEREYRQAKGKLLTIKY